jgi:hypothetical protein
MGVASSMRLGTAARNRWPKRPALLLSRLVAAITAGAEITVWKGRRGGARLKTSSRVCGRQAAAPHVALPPIRAITHVDGKKTKSSRSALPRDVPPVMKPAKGAPGATRRHRRDSWAPAQQGTALRDLRFLLQPPIRMRRDCSHGRGHAGCVARTCRLAAPATHDASRFVLRCSLAVFRCEIPRRMSGAGASRHPWNRR